MQAAVHHVAFEVDRAMFDQVQDTAQERGIGNVPASRIAGSCIRLFQDPLDS